MIRLFKKFLYINKKDETTINNYADTIKDLAKGNLSLFEKNIDAYIAHFNKLADADTVKALLGYKKFMEKRATMVKIKDFVGLKVISPYHKETCIIDGITSVYITIKVDTKPYPSYYRYETGTAHYDNAFTRGSLKFENPDTQRLFIEVYEAYTHSKEGMDEAFIINFQRYD